MKGKVISILVIAAMVATVSSGCGNVKGKTVVIDNNSGITIKESNPLIIKKLFETEKIKLEGNGKQQEYYSQVFLKNDYIIQFKSKNKVNPMVQINEFIIGNVKIGKITKDSKIQWKEIKVEGKLINSYDGSDFRIYVDNSYFNLDVEKGDLIKINGYKEALKDKSYTPNNFESKGNGRYDVYDSEDLNSKIVIDTKTGKSMEIPCENNNMILSDVNIVGNEAYIILSNKITVKGKEIQIYDTEKKSFKKLLDLKEDMGIESFIYVNGDNMLLLGKGERSTTIYNLNKLNNALTKLIENDYSNSTKFYISPDEKYILLENTIINNGDVDKKDIFLGRIIDNKGFGKFTKFDINKDDSFVNWNSKVGDFTVSEIKDNSLVYKVYEIKE